MIYTREKPSQLYLHCVKRATEHHATSKTFSGKFLRPHAPYIKEIMDRLDCKTILDYGCGKGKQYEWVSHGEDASIPAGMTIADYWGITGSVRTGRTCLLYDPGVPKFAKYPKGTFDMVICTHVLGSVPKSDLNWFITELLNLTNKAIYIAEKIGPVGKTVFSNPAAMPWNWTHEHWRDLLSAYKTCGAEIWLSTRTPTPDGVVTKRELVE